MRKKHYKEFCRPFMAYKIPFRSLFLSMALLLVVVFSVSASESTDIENNVNKNLLLQQIEVKGTITDAETGAPLPGVNIVIEGTQTGVVSDNNGKYSITVPDGNSVILFSYLGYTSQNINVNGRTILDVALQPDFQVLSEIVIVGFGSQKKVNLTGAVATMPEDALENRAITNVSQGLQGMVPGLNITSGGGGLEASPKINIRGVATIGEGSSGSPLILVDGMEADINALNPNDIESISVLKDAAASSIYGSRAPFGVVLITTKSGKKGKMQVTYNNNFSSNIPIVLPKIMNSLDFVEYWNIANTNSGGGNFFNEERIQRIKDYKADPSIGGVIPDPNNPTRWGDLYSYGNADVDWYREVYRTSSPSQEHSLSASGGTDKFNYFVSGNYLGQEGLLKINNDTYKRYTVTSKLNVELTDWASLSYTGRFTRQESDRPSALTNNFFHHIARQGWPVLPMYDPNGYLLSGPSPALALRDGGNTTKQTDWNYQQFNLTLEPVKGWKIYSNLNFKTGDEFVHWDVLPTYVHDVAGNPVYSHEFHYFGEAKNEVHEEAYRESYISPNVYTEYSKSLGLHNVKAMAGFQSEINNKRFFSAERVGLIVPSSPSIDITTGTLDGELTPPEVRGYYETWSLFGYFGRLNYDYDGRYLLEANFRYDGTSRFREENRWKLFPSFSLGWNIAKEDFWSSMVSTVNLLKVRGSYGSLGNQNMNALYPTYVTMPFEAGGSEWLVNGIQPNKSWAPGLISSELTWETVNTYNIGVDLGLFNNRLNSSFDYFVRYTNDMIGPAPELPVILGTDVPRTNNTDLKTSGFELILNWKDRLNNGIGYSVGFNLADSRTLITNYPNPTGDLGTYIKDQYYGNIWGYTTMGIAQSDEQMNQHLESLPEGGQSALGANWEAGDIMYEDVNGDGKIDNGSYTLDDHGDLTLIGNSTPRYLFGLNLSADWKGIDFRMFLQGVGKRDVWQGSAYMFGAGPTHIWESVAFTEHLDYWSEENPDAYYPRPMFNGGKNTQVQTRYLLNGSYLRVKNLQIGYTLPATLVQRIQVKNLRIFVSGENLLTFTKLPGQFDPETVRGGDESGVGGWGGSAYPLTKVYSAGISVTF